MISFLPVLRPVLGLAKLSMLSLGMVLSSGLHAAERTYLTVEAVDGVPLNVVTVGNPEHPSIVFVHGIGQSHASFMRQLDSDLADDYYLVAFDLRGHGNSGKPWLAEAYNRSEVWAQDLDAVLVATKAHKPVVVAWSYGTLVLADYIRHCGTDALRGVNLVGSLGALVPMVPSGDKALYAKFIAHRKLQHSQNVQDNASTVEQSVEWLTAVPVDADSQSLFGRVGMMLPAYARTAMSQRKFDNSDQVEKFSFPVLISRGDKDPSMPSSATDSVIKKLADVRSSTYPNTGHSPFFEQSKRFNTELREFVQALPAVKPKD